MLQIHMLLLPLMLEQLFEHSNKMLVMFKISLNEMIFYCFAVQCSCCHDVARLMTFIAVYFCDDLTV